MVAVLLPESGVSDVLVAILPVTSGRPLGNARRPKHHEDGIRRSISIGN